MKSNLYRRVEKNTAAWDLTAGCRKYIINSKSQRQLRKKLRKMARKKINKFFT